MNPPPARAFRPAGFRLQLWLAIMAIVVLVTGAVLIAADRHLEAEAQRNMEDEFRSALASLHQAQGVRHAELIERCRALVRKPRIHAALEDEGALEQLYPSAEDELSDVMQGGGEVAAFESPSAGGAESPDGPPALRATFYRFLDRDGALIRPPRPAAVGALLPAEAGALSLPGVPQRQQTGYLPRSGRVAEVITTPIVSGETGEVIAALALGFAADVPGGAGDGIRSGIWTAGRLLAPALGARAGEIQSVLAPILASGSDGGGNLPVTAGGEAGRLFYTRLNPSSMYAPAYEISLYSLAPLAARQARVRWTILTIAAIALLAALIASRVATRQLAAPVEKLAVDSERSARFSADASHQLKTPVAVLRAGLEELLAREHFTSEECTEISNLVHQTYRLSSLIEDLLLLSRMDSGRLKLDLLPVNLSGLIEAAIDDLGAGPGADALTIDARVPAELWIAGERRYTAIILQNLLENARKYNRPGGTVRVAAHAEDGEVVVTVGNTGSTIPQAGRDHIFERFHRGTIGENVPGYGLGLNLSRDLARIHGGDLRLVSSGDDWTEFELRLHAAPTPIQVASA